MKRKISRVCVTVVLVASVGNAVSVPVSAIEVRDMDQKIKPADDFFRFANGGWLDRTKLTADKGSVSNFDAADELLTSQIRVILKTPSTDASSDIGKATAMFRQGTDLATRNRAGIKPIEKQIAQINQAKSLQQLNKIIEQSPLENFGLFNLFVKPSFTDPTRSELALLGPSLGLLGRDLYLATDAASKAIQSGYRENNAQLLQFTGLSKADATTMAKAAYDMELAIAKLLLDQRVVQEDQALWNNPRTLPRLQSMYDLIDWGAMLRNAGMQELPKTVTVAELKYVEGLKALLQTSSPQSIRSLYLVQLLRSTADSLSEEMEATVFEFFGKTLQGISVQSPLEKRVASQVGSSFPDAIGRAYVEKHFSAQARAQVTDMTKQIVTAFGKRIDSNGWMSSATKAKAKAKLSKMKLRIGYPDRWESAANVVIGETYADTVRSAKLVSVRRDLNKVGKSIDNSNWGPVAWVNAFYDAFDNSMNFPAGILVPPFLDPTADAATNYGAIGVIIGHELTHGFDISGSQYDGDGRLSNWWTDADRSAFTELNDQVVKQYSALKLPYGLKVDGKLTVGENVADMGGLNTAFDAFLAQQRSGKKPSPMIDGFTPEQRFIISFGNVFRSKDTAESFRTKNQIDVHAPDIVRSVQPLRNTEVFHRTFKIRSGTRMYLAPKDRIVIW